MKLTAKQVEEINFLETFFNVGWTTIEQREEYIQVSVYGRGSGHVMQTKNPLLLAKRSLDIDIKNWRKDLADGLVMIDEFQEFIDHPYGKKLFRGILKGIKFDWTPEIEHQPKGYLPIKVFNFLTQGDWNKI